MTDYRGRRPEVKGPLVRSRVRRLLTRGRRGARPPVVPVADRSAVLRSGLVDREWVAAQLGTDIATDRQAVEAYLGAGDGVSPHPLFLIDWLPERAARPDPDDDPLLWYLRNAEIRANASLHPLVSVSTIERLLPGSRSEPDGPVSAWLRQAAPESLMPAPEHAPTLTWGEVRAASFEALGSWQNGPALPGAVDGPRSPGSVSLVRVDNPSNRATVRTLLATAGPSFTDRLVVTPDPTLAHYVGLSILGKSVGSTSIIAVPPATSPALALDAAARGSLGETLVISTGRSRIEPDAVEELVDVLRSSSAAVAQPVLLTNTGLVRSAGGIFPTSAPDAWPLLADHHPDDLPSDRALEVPVALSDVLSIRADDYVELGGVDGGCPLVYAGVDLSLRARAQGRRVVTATRARMLSTLPLPPVARDQRTGVDRLRRGHGELDETLSARTWAAVGLEQVGVGEGGAPVVRRLRAVVEEGAPRLHWVIDTAVPVGQSAWWGDHHFAMAIKRALEDMGQHVVVDNRRGRDRATRDLDDVQLVLRGLDVPLTRPALVNIEWVISHPDLVTGAELESFDLVFAASYAWSAEAHRRWGVEVRPLLQATDPMLFNPARGEHGSGHGVLFVGNSRGIFRPAVRHAIDSEADLTIIGSGWGDFLGEQADRLVVAPSVDNAEVGALYASAGVVLNDHWEDMRESGFVSNRLMDAAASGAWILSDEVASVDLTELFAGLVRTFRSAEDVRRVLAARTTLFPQGEARVEAARRVAAEHSFAHRAEVLLDEALHVRALKR